MRRPNLFDYATSELSQDAILCWLLSWAEDKHSSTGPGLHRLGFEVLALFFSKAGLQPPARIQHIDLRKQEAGIDILCLVNDDAVVLVEDKVMTIQHSGQLERYEKYVRDNYPGRYMVRTYLQTGDQGNYEAVVKAGYSVVRRCDLLSVLENSAGIEAGQQSDIVGHYAAYLRDLENRVQSYAVVPPSKWEWRAWHGFYSRLQQELDGGDWGYVPNGSGGFVGFWWHWLDDSECSPYLQLEQEKLCFKINVTEKANRVTLRGEWHERVIAESQKQGLSVKRPGRLGNGVTMTVAVLDGDYRVTNGQGVLDMGATRDVLRNAELVLKGAWRQKPPNDGPNC